MRHYSASARWFLSATVVVITFAWCGTVFAQVAVPSGSVMVAPVKTELTMLPGKSQTVELTVGNGTPLPLSVTITYEDIAGATQVSSTDDPIKLLGTEKEKHSLTELISFPEQSFDLLSGREVKIPITITIPKDAIARSQYGSVLFHFKPEKSTTGVAPANIAVESRIATLFFIRIAGDVKEEGQLSVFNLFNNAVSSPIPSSHAPLRFQVAFQNSGDTHLDPYGRVTVSDFLGRTTMLSIDPWVVLPGATRMRELDLTSALLPGYYHAHLELNRGYKDVVDERDIAFWITPTTTQIFVGFILLLFLVLLIRRSLQLSRNFVT